MVSGSREVAEAEALVEDGFRVWWTRVLRWSVRVEMVSSRADCRWRRESRRVGFWEIVGVGVWAAGDGGGAAIVNCLGMQCFQVMAALVVLVVVVVIYSDCGGGL